MNLAEELKKASEQAIIRLITSDDWLQPNYANRLKIPEYFLKEVWELVDFEKVKQHLAARIDSEIADRLINHIAKELAGDIKQILSVKERREDIRAMAREYINRFGETK